MRLIVSLLRFVYAICSLQRVKQKVSFFSRQSNEPSVDFSLLQEMIEQECEDVEIVCMTKMIEGHRFSYPFHMLRQIYHIASSRLVIIDGYCIPVSCLDLKEGTKVIQIWHAQTAVKKFGLQTVGLPSGSSRKLASVMRMHRNYDHVISPSKQTAAFFGEGMGTEADRFVYAFMPHTIKMIEEVETVRRTKREELGLDDGKKTILYAPTFRRGQKVPANELFACVDRNKYDFIFRPHPIDTDLETLDADMKVDFKSSIYDLITAADIVITDYSSIMVETLLLEKDIYIFAYDIEEYKEDPGLNIDLSDDVFKGIFFTDAKELTIMLEKGPVQESAATLRSLLIDEDIPLSNDRLLSLIKEELR